MAYINDQYKQILNHKNIIQNPKNNKSIGQKLIRYYLNLNNINFIEQFTFEKCRDKNKLPFDFYLPDVNTCIEYDGILHFQQSLENKGKSHWVNRQSLEYQQGHDILKDEFCLKNNIKLIRINYKQKQIIQKILFHHINNLGLKFDLNEDKEVDLQDLILNKPKLRQIKLFHRHHGLVIFTDVKWFSQKYNMHRSHIYSIINGKGEYVNGWHLPETTVTFERQARFIHKNGRDSGIVYIDDFCEENDLNKQSMHRASLGVIDSCEGWHLYGSEIKQQKIWKYKNPKGQTVQIKGSEMKNFCKENKLTYECMVTLFNNPEKLKKSSWVD